MSKKKNSVRLTILLFSFLLFGNFFILPYTIRDYFFGTNIAYFNIFWLVGFILAFLNIFDFFINSYTKKKIFYIIAYIIIVFILFFAFGLYVSMFDMIKRFTTMCLPIVFIFFKFKRKEDLELFFLYTVKYVNFGAFFIVICGVIDLLGNRLFSNIFLEIYSEYVSLPKQYDMNRIISYYGHPLYTSEIMLIYIALNEIKFRVFSKKTNLTFHYLICIIGLAFTSSKSAFACFFIYAFIINFSKLKRLIPIIIIVFIGYVKGFFTTILGRFQRDIKIGNLTSNRNTSIATLTKNGSLDFNFFKGTANSVPNNPIFLAALEYPPLQFAYTHGIVYVIAIYLSLLLFPIVKFLKMSKLKIFFISNLLIIFVFVNTFNGLSTGRDNFMLYATYVFLLINIADLVNDGGVK